MTKENIKELIIKCDYDFYKASRYVANVICKDYLCVTLDCVHDTVDLANIIQNYACAIEQYTMGEITDKVLLSDYLEFKSDIIYQVQIDID